MTKAEAADSPGRSSGRSTRSSARNPTNASSSGDTEKKTTAATEKKAPPAEKKTPATAAASTTSTNTTTSKAAAKVSTTAATNTAAGSTKPAPPAKKTTTVKHEPPAPKTAPHAPPSTGATTTTNTTTTTTTTTTVAAASTSTAPPKIVKQKKLPRSAKGSAAAASTGGKASGHAADLKSQEAGGRVNYYGNKFGFKYVCPACLDNNLDPFSVWLDEKFKPVVTAEGKVRDDEPWTRAFKNKKTDMRLHYQDKHKEIPEYEYPMGFIEIKRIEERKYMEEKKLRQQAGATEGATPLVPPAAAPTPVPASEEPLANVKDEPMPDAAEGEKPASV
eukprot:scaffold2785_cov179-Amphora_coffeaeformis.AAC.4